MRNVVQVDILNNCVKVPRTHIDCNNRITQMVCYGSYCVYFYSLFSDSKTSSSNLLSFVGKNKDDKQQGASNKETMRSTVILFEDVSVLVIRLYLF